MGLFRLHLKPATADDKNRDDVVAYCIDHRVAGIGWSVSLPKGKVINAPDGYEELAWKEYGRKVPSVNFAWCQPDDLIWSRDSKGFYYLGRVTGSYRYNDSEEALALDIPNQLPCDWVKLPNESYVPGKVIASFRQRRAFQGINKAVLRYSQKLYNQKKGKNYYDIKEEVLSADTFFKMIQDDDCEDIVGLFLQAKRNYVIIPSSNKKDTQAFEYVLKHRYTGKTALVQVKQGDVDLDGNYGDREEQIFLFTTEGRVNDPSENVVVLGKEQLFDFVLENRAVLPERILVWFER